VIAQPVVRDVGWEHKVWVIGDRLYAARRRPQLDERGYRTELTPCEPLREGLEDLARATGAAFGLELYGVDVLISERGPVAVDVNPFPGFRRVPSAGATLAAHVMGVMTREKALA
jgi:ribosomal protein S6--L-glutamate ligase